MTMKLTIKNEDQTRTATVTSTDHSPSGTYETDVKLAPGEQRDFYVHVGRTLTVREDPEELK